LSLLFCAEVFAPGGPVVFFPAVADAGEVGVGDVDVGELDAGAFAGLFGEEEEGEGGVNGVGGPFAGAPGLDDEAVGDEVEDFAGEGGVEGAELAEGTGVDFGGLAGEGGVGFGVEVHGIESVGGSGEGGGEEEVFHGMGFPYFRLKVIVGCVRLRVLEGL
jgi:hypothetical protein